MDGLIENKCGIGRISIQSDTAKMKILKEIKMDPKVSAVKLAAETSQIIGKSVSTEIMRNLIRQVGYKSKVVKKKPFMNLQNQKKCLEFAKTHQLKTDTFWKKVVILLSSLNIPFLTVSPYGESPIHTAMHPEKCTSYS
ncbi:HTH_Tnp_Tc3_2 domain-containing protein [Trichonephila clavata]|uniref:HTH_Tnp_Tc3_2 domain-containing protein n=1 Tax=Trichonephila clavata TaxID=2740835 RepID=A0A8X6I659_TRICU|nr:HTH_Tnp_Tc3_2 domain-containing protein [Trichonephila clavata]